MINAGIKFNVEGAEQANQKINQLKAALAGIGEAGMNLNPLGSSRDLDIFFREMQERRKRLLEAIGSEGLTKRGISEVESKRLEGLKSEIKAIDELSKQVKDLFAAVRRGKADIKGLTDSLGLRQLGIGEMLSLKLDQARAKYEEATDEKSARAALIEIRNISAQEKRMLGEELSESRSRRGIAESGFYAGQFQKIAGSVGGPVGEVVGAGIQLAQAAAESGMSVAEKASNLVSKVLEGGSRGGIIGAVMQFLSTAFFESAKTATLTAGLAAQMTLPRGIDLQNAIAQRFMMLGGLGGYSLDKAGRYADLGLSLTEVQPRLVNTAKYFGGNIDETIPVFKQARAIEMIGQLSEGELGQLIGTMRYGKFDKGNRGEQIAEILKTIVGISRASGVTGIFNNAGLGTFLQNTSAFQQMQVGRFDETDAVKAASLVAVFEKIGGMFGGQNMMNVAGRIDAAITSGGGGNPYMQARLYQALSADKPTMTVDQLMERVEQGLTAENLKAILAYEKAAFGGDETATIRALRGYGLSTAEARRLLKYEGDIGGSEFMAAEKVDVSSEVLVPKLNQLNIQMSDTMAIVGNSFISEIQKIIDALKPFATAVSGVTQTLEDNFKALDEKVKELQALEAPAYAIEATRNQVEAIKTTLKAMEEEKRRTTGRGK